MCLTLLIHNFAFSNQLQAELIKILLQNQEGNLAYNKKLIADAEAQSGIRPISLVIGTSVATISSLFVSLLIISRSIPSSERNKLLNEKGEKEMSNSDIMKSILFLSAFQAFGLLTMGIAASLPHTDTEGIQTNISSIKETIARLQTLQAIVAASPQTQPPTSTGMHTTPTIIEH